MNGKWYVGVRKDGLRVAFTSVTETTAKSNVRYFRVIGPFPSQKGAVLATLAHGLDASIGEYERIARERVGSRSRRAKRQ